MSGYKIIPDQYLARTGLKHSRKQLRNILSQMKQLYTFWLFLQAQSGLGRHPNETVLAPSWWWKRYAQMEEMFQDVIVDGSTSFIAGQDAEEEEPEDEPEDDPAEDPAEQFQDLDQSPMSTNSHKRSSSVSTESTATSPSKKSKSPMVMMMRELVTKWSYSDDATQQALKQATTEKKQRLIL
ncbi:U3 small nucleolar RNA-associated protein 25-like isoform X2 [Panicum miliaceum]|uniref:U3 small nucleolar RNA-associated protein 25-like isoform X2 n=1 Tax=Panicum miliaceum TaxID=4540 RepID=A0A3L6PKJ7_PANMI|nr:U3 small nucleolar RNA-associated protein 25-like isoform X2 [Panicum miliaceum]